LGSFPIFHSTFCFDKIGEGETKSQIRLQKINTVLRGCSVQIGQFWQIAHAPLSSSDTEPVESTIDLSLPILLYFPKLLMGNKDTLGDLLQGTLDMLILKTLSRGLHGYAIAEFIDQTSEDVLHVEEGALYPALHRLELRALLASKWDISGNNRRAKYYSLTAAGRKRLTAEAEHWIDMNTAIACIMKTA
jgi:PadR family transcriptional regulator, regulatory protein PadR